MAHSNKPQHHSPTAIMTLENQLSNNSCQLDIKCSFWPMEILQYDIVYEVVIGISQGHVLRSLIFVMNRYDMWDAVYPAVAN